ncbi:hypothetical protein KC853_00760 [Candidatus Saccharibacteria bacterium]|nr:hypothetical protein [Candidatus Saccharibacteria bacterium]MCB9834578.1 hypothetical protein [Candidatus Nomurabacteria bacterium]
MNNQEILDWLGRVIGLFDQDAKLEYGDLDKPEFRVVSEDSLVIKNRAEIIKALEYLISQIAPYQEGIRPSLDINGYKKERQEKLMMMAENTADQVVGTGRDKVLPEMNSFERRIIHIVLADRDDVVTESVGEGRLKRVKILPKQ